MHAALIGSIGKRQVQRDVQTAVVTHDRAAGTDGCRRAVRIRWRRTRSGGSPHAGLRKAPIARADVQALTCVATGKLQHNTDIALSIVHVEASSLGRMGTGAALGARAGLTAR